MRQVLLDITPLRHSRPYRFLYLGTVTSGIGAQLATTAIALQIYEITGSSFSVGLVGLYALVPILVLGLYGGAVLDTHDRRTVALVGGVVLWGTGGLNVLQAALGTTHVGVLYALVALHSGGFAIMSPARSSIYPRLLPLEQLPAANALNVASMNISMTVGPLLAGVIVQYGGYVTAYSLDVLLFTAAMWGLSTLPRIRPEGTDPARVPGLSSVVDGLRFLGTRPNVRMTFLADFCAMILAQPRALFPAIAVVALAGGEATVGILAAALAIGAVLAMLFSGPLGTVIHQGRAVVWAVGAPASSCSGLPSSVPAAGSTPARRWCWPAPGSRPLGRRTRCPRSSATPSCRPRRRTTCADDSRGSSSSWWLAGRGWESSSPAASPSPSRSGAPWCWADWRAWPPCCCWRACNPDSPSMTRATRSLELAFPTFRFILFLTSLGAS